MKSVENQVDSCSSATQDCNASEFVDGDQADSENVTVADGVTFINGVAVSDTNHEKKGGVELPMRRSLNRKSRRASQRSQVSLLEREVPSKLAIKSQGRVVVFLLKNPSGVLIGFHWSF